MKEILDKEESKERGCLEAESVTLQSHSKTPAKLLFSIRKVGFNYLLLELRPGLQTALAASLVLYIL